MSGSESTWPPSLVLGPVPPGLPWHVAQPRSRRSFLRSRWWRVIRFVVGLALAGLALAVLNGQRDELVGASSALAHLRIGWLLAAIGAEVVSFVSFGALQRRLLRCGGVTIRLGFATALSLAAGAIASSLPGGPAFSSVYAFRQYRRKGADEALAGWVLLATLVCAALGLGLLSTAGVLLASRQGASYDLVGVIFGVLVITGLADAIVWQRRWLARFGITCLRLSRRLVGRPKREGVEIVEELFTRLSEVHLGWRDVVLTLLAGIADWAFDCGALACSFLAVGVGVPWRGLLLAYGAGQLAANLPITPGGLGVVEGSLTIALVAFGGAELSTVAAVLCYRIVSFWGYLPVGWLSWGTIALAERRSGRLSKEALPTALSGAGSIETGIVPLSALPKGDDQGEDGSRMVGR